MPFKHLKEKLFGEVNYTVHTCGYIILFESVTTVQLNHFESTAAAKLNLATSLPCHYFS